MVTAIIAAAGQGKRMGRGINKIFIPLSHCPVLIHTIQMFLECREISRLVVVAAPDEMLEVEEMLRALPEEKPLQVVAGGSERQHSISNALAVVPAEADIIVVHDGARPLVTEEMIENVITAARKHRAAVIAVPVKDTIKISDSEGCVLETPDRSKLWAVQTPQAFEAGLLRQAYQNALNTGFLATDDASLVEKLGVTVKLIPGSYRNLKITTPEDLVVAEALINQGRGEEMTHVGIGYDVHRLVEGRKLVLGGVDVPFEYGLLGHSDADVLLHAVKDALLGAAALGDIGQHFPDSDPQYKGVSSLFLLAKVKKILAEQGYKPYNIDATIVAQRPKLVGYIASMCANIAQTLELPEQRVNVKATTTEGLGFAGQGEGIAAYATATVIKNSI